MFQVLSRIIAVFILLAFLGCGNASMQSGAMVKTEPQDKISVQGQSKDSPKMSEPSLGGQGAQKTADESSYSQSQKIPMEEKKQMTASSKKMESLDDSKMPAQSMKEDSAASKPLAQKSMKKKTKSKNGGSSGESSADMDQEIAFEKEKNEKDKLKEDVKQARELYLSADDSNSQASPVIVRKMIQKGKFVPSDIIRTYEFLNYYTFDYQAPEKAPLQINASIKSQEKKGEYSLQAAVRSQNKTFKQLKSFNVTFLLDISGSMAGEPIELARKIISGFAGKLKKGSIISLVTCNNEAKIVLDSHKINDKTIEKINEILNKIKVNNVTDLEKGILKAYELASKNFSNNYLNRVIVISDGATNTGKTAIATIAKHAEDSDKQGIYLAGIGLGEGFNDQLMNAFTDKGRGAYIFIDSEKEISHILDDIRFIQNFDLALKDIRLKMKMPEGWKMQEFHGEQVSTKASEVTPQYLAPNDQMIYHMTLATDKSPEKILSQSFEFEAEYTSLGEKSGKISAVFKGAELVKKSNAIIKGDAVVEYAEMFKKIQYPLDKNKKENLKHFQKAFQQVTEANEKLKDNELSEILATMEKYKKILEYGEQFPGSRDKEDTSIGAALGISPNLIKEIKLNGDNPKQAIKVLPRLLNSIRLTPQEGYKFLLISSGPVGNQHPAGGGSLSNKQWKDPTPEYMGYKKARNDNKPCYDLHQVTIRLKAPKNAKSFSFDFNFFSAEYPNFVKKNFNDTFYAILQAKSTNNGASTNISFDSNNDSIEVDNNYFENEFHPIPNIGTGFDNHGSTGWLRTSWPIKGGEEFIITFSIHDEGDGIYDSLTVIDNFQFHEYEAVGTTDPLN